MAKSVARERRVRFRPQPKAAARANLHDRDMYRWTRQQARLLRAGRMSELDLENLAEEIESLGNRDYRELRSRLVLIVMHLLKWRCQPQKRTRSWLSTISTQRREIRQILEQSPSLKRQAVAMFLDAYMDALKDAALETGLDRDAFPAAPPFTPEQALDPDYMPQD